MIVLYAAMASLTFTLAVICALSAVIQGELSLLSIVAIAGNGLMSGIWVGVALNELKKK